MAQVEQLPLPLLLLVPLHHTGLVFHAPGDHLRRVRFQRAVLKEGEQALVAEDPGFHRLRRPVGKDLWRQGFQAVRIAQHGGGLEEGPGQILPGL